MSFDPKTAKYGDVYSSYRKDLVYVGVAPLKRAGVSAPPPFSRTAEEIPDDTDLSKLRT